MTLNIAEEYIKLTKIVGNDIFNYKFMGNNLWFNDTRINFLWHVLTLTIKYPQVELYLKDLINCFTVDEIRNWTILYQMSRYASKISSGAFEIIINYGADVNIQQNNDNTAVHIFLRNMCDNHINSILKLFIKHGFNLNATNKNNETVLDTLIIYQKNLNEETKNCIMTLVDSDVMSGILYKNNKIYNFIEYYKNSSIKPAIKK